MSDNNAHTHEVLCDIADARDSVTRALKHLRACGETDAHALALLAQLEKLENDAI